MNNHTLKKIGFKVRELLRFGRPVFSNIAEGTHSGNITQYLETTITARYLIAKAGTASGKITLCGSGDKPFGIITDEGVLTDPVNMALLGCAQNTLLVKTAGAISAGDDVVVGSGASAIALPASAGTYYVIGQAVADAASGALVELDPCTPRAVTVS